jgi:hypothetical protein
MRLRSRLWLSLALGSLLLACGGGGGGEPAPAPNPPTSPPVAESPRLTDAEAMAKALALWRNDDLSKHPKGSCAGCHGADFFDLARIGSTDLDIVRRAQIDGASADEAAALVQAVRKLRLDHRLPATDARRFRPFQPGGAVLLADSTEAPHLAAVRRDIAFGQQLQALLPTWFGPRIATLAQAEQAREELLDLARGSNLAGHNPRRLNLRQLPTGVVYPLWSADRHHGAAEGTLNDWLADIAHDPRPEFKAQWHALQDRWMADPSDENFWRMVSATRTMTQVPLLGACTMDGLNPALACGATDDFNRHKFVAALMGQHLMRQEALGRQSFADGALAFAYLDTDLRFAFMRERPSPQFLPNDLWEVGDRARVMLDDSSRTGSFRDNLRKLGYPAFVLDSIDPERTEGQEQQALRLAWFWIGFTFDPSFARIHASNSTRVGEYMVGSLIDEHMFLHNSFAAHMRLAAAGFLPEAQVVARTRPARVERVQRPFLMDYSYFIGYNRTVLRWNEDRRVGRLFPQALRDEQAALWHRFTANGFRAMSLLQMRALDTEPLASDAAARTRLRDMLQDEVDASTGSVRRGTLYALHRSFSTYQPEHDAADDALLAALAAKAGAALPAY